jgi:hypothetical protein
MGLVGSNCLMFNPLGPHEIPASAADPWKQTDCVPAVTVKAPVAAQPVMGEALAKLAAATDIADPIRILRSVVIICEVKTFLLPEIQLVFVRPPTLWWLKGILTGTSAEGQYFVRKKRLAHQGSVPVLK